MFTGIIIAAGRVDSIVQVNGDLELGVDAAAIDPARMALGDSVSVQGVCLTVTRRALCSSPMCRVRPCPRPRSAGCGRDRG